MIPRKYLFYSNLYQFSAQLRCGGSPQKSLGKKRLYKIGGSFMLSSSLSANLSLSYLLYHAVYSLRRLSFRIVKEYLASVAMMAG